MRILVLGGDGMLGHKMLLTIRALFPHTYCTVRKPKKDSPVITLLGIPQQAVFGSVDARDFTSCEGVISNLKPMIVINCIGLIKHRELGQSPIESIQVNALFPHQLAAHCKKLGAFLVHFSTDCVFSGRKGNYTENDVSDAEDTYGRTKYIGEIREEQALTIRTSIIGRELSNHHGLLEWLLSNNHGNVNGYTKAIFSGVTTNYLARLVRELLKDKPLSGLFHVGGDPISKYDLLKKLIAAYSLDIKIEPESKFQCDRSMSHAQFEQATGIKTPSWDHMIADLIEDPTPYSHRRFSV